jgi:ABC-type multidrug transport system fused ATPase/permease subunit
VVESVKYFPRVLRYLRPYWRLAGVSAALIVLGGLIGLLLPWPLKVLVDNVLGTEPLPPALAGLLGPLAGHGPALLVVTVIAGFLLVVVQNALGVLDNYVNTRLDQGMVLDFRSDLFQHIQRLSLTHHDRRRSGMLIYAINFQADAAARLVMAVSPLAQSALTLIGMFWIAMRMDYQLALLSLAVVPFLYCSVGYYIRHIQPRLEKVRAMEGESLSIIHEAVAMMRVIVAFGREDHEYQRFRSQGEGAVKARVKVTVSQTLFSLAVNTITAAGTTLVLGLGALHVLDGQLTVGSLLVMMAYIASVYKPLEAISTTIGSLQEVLVSLKMAFSVLDIEPDLRDEPGAVDVAQMRGAITFGAVGFSYPGRKDTLRDVSFEARPGQVIAVAGPTGAGKTTLISLIPRFYACQQGSILLDGVDVRRLKLRSLRQHISIVLQEPLLFSGTIYDNIRYGRLQATRDEVIAAARAANAHDFIVQLPKKYDTELGERGAQLSGGERQRIAVARAFLKDAPILILDEPTSSIDSRTEAVILDALDRLMEGRTTFLIAHRLSTIRRADHILVLDRGRLVEQGTHESLLCRGGLYRQLYDMQNRNGDSQAQEDWASVPGGGEG